MDENSQTPPGGAPADPAYPPRLTVVSQYVKDLSFENPRAPRSLQAGEARPEIQIRVDVRAQQVEAEQYEVSLQLHAEAKSGAETAFMVELTYAGLFGLLNIPPESLQPLLLIECPRLLFPFARRVVADATRDGGFPPLLIDPIDFATLYRRRQQQAQAPRQAEGAPIANSVVGDGASN
jgi:preprotein translocase subunit SecB